MKPKRNRLKRIAIIAVVLMAAVCSQVVYAGPGTWLVRAGYDAFAAEEAVTTITRAGTLAGSPSADVLLAAYRNGSLNLEALPTAARSILSDAGGGTTGSAALVGLGKCGAACDAAQGVLQDVEAAATTAVGSPAKSAKVIGYDDYTMVSFVGGEFAMPTRELQASHKTSGFGLRPVDGPLLLSVDSETIQVANSPLTEAIMANNPTQILIQGAPSSVAGQWTLERVWVETSEGWVQLEQGPLHTIRSARVGPPLP